MSSINNLQMPGQPAVGQFPLEDHRGGTAAHGTTGGSDAAAAKAQAKSDEDAAAAGVTEKRIKAQADQGPQDISAANLSKMMLATGATNVGTALPELPQTKVANPVGAAKEASTALTNMSFANISGFSEMAANQLMRQAGEKAFDAQARAHQINQKGQINAQMDSAVQAEKKAQADKSSAVVSFLGALGGVAATGGMAYKGSSGAKPEKPAASKQSASTPLANQNEITESLTSDNARRAARSRRVDSVHEAEKSSEAKHISEASVSDAGEQEKIAKRRAEKAEGEAIKDETDGVEKANSTVPSIDEGARRAGIYSASAGAGQLVTSGVEAFNQNALFGKQSHEAEIAGKFDDVMVTMYKTAEESSKTGKEKAQKMIDDAISGLKQHFDLVKSANDRIG